MKKTEIPPNLRPATKEDFKEEAALYDQAGNCHVIIERYDVGIWNTRGKVVFESNAHLYRVEDLITSKKEDARKAWPDTDLFNR